MRKNWKIAIALALALCFVLALMACNDDGYVYVYETDEAGETVTDSEGNPVIETDEDGEKVTTPDTNKDGIADKDQTDENGNVAVVFDSDFMLERAMAKQENVSRLSDFVSKHVGKKTEVTFELLPAEESGDTVIDEILDNFNS